MSAEYNPIVRTFNAVRAAILLHTAARRCDVRPGAALRSLIPPERRRAVWAQLRRRGLDVYPPRLRAPAYGLCWLAVIPGAAAALVWLGPCPALLVAAPLAAGVTALSNPWVGEPLQIGTVGELAVQLTRFRDHRASGYRPSRGDIALKVRLIVSEHLGVPLEQVKESSSFVEDLGAD